MAALNGKGPNNNNFETGRRLGNCTKNTDGETSHFSLGIGMGKRRNAGMNRKKSN